MRVVCCLIKHTLNNKRWGFLFVCLVCCCCFNKSLSINNLSGQCWIGLILCFPNFFDFLHSSNPSILHCFLLFSTLFHPDSSGQQQPSSIGAQPHSGASDPGPIRATAPMWRCSRIMHMQRELHPTLLSSLEGIVDQMVWFRENWHEEVRKNTNKRCRTDFAAAKDQKARKYYSFHWEFSCMTVWTSSVYKGHVKL